MLPNGANGCIAALLPNDLFYLDRGNNSCSGLA
jgi:hypothetical protein